MNTSFNLANGIAMVHSIRTEVLDTLKAPKLEHFRATKQNSHIPCLDSNGLFPVFSRESVATASYRRKGVFVLPAR